MIGQLGNHFQIYYINFNTFQKEVYFLFLIFFLIKLQSKGTRKWDIQINKSVSSNIILFSLLSYKLHKPIIQHLIFKPLVLSILCQKLYSYQNGRWRYFTLELHLIMYFMHVRMSFNNWYLKVEGNIHWTLILLRKDLKISGYRKYSRDILQISTPLILCN